MTQALVTSFVHPEPFLGLTDQFRDAVAAVAELTGAESTGWQASPELVAINSLEWFNTVFAVGLTATYTAVVGNNRRMSEPDEIGKFGSDSGRYGLTVTFTPSDDVNPRLEHSGIVDRILAHLGATDIERYAMADEAPALYSASVGDDIPVADGTSGGVIASVPPRP